MAANAYPRPKAALPDTTPLRTLAAPATSDAWLRIKLFAGCQLRGCLNLPLQAWTLHTNRLTVCAFFRDVSDMGFPQFEPPAEGVIVAFENVEAFKAYEEFTDPLFAEQLEVPMLAENVPYGGSWGFIRILGSSWLARLADRNGSWDADSASHWVVKTGDKVLHVANILSTVPIFQGWIPPN